MNLFDLRYLVQSINVEATGGQWSHESEWGGWPEAVCDRRSSNQPITLKSTLPAVYGCLPNVKTFLPGDKLSRSSPSAIPNVKIPALRLNSTETNGRDREFGRALSKWIEPNALSCGTVHRRKQCQPCSTRSSAKKTRRC